MWGNTGSDRGDCDTPSNDLTDGQENIYMKTKLDEDGPWTSKRYRCGSLGGFAEAHRTVNGPSMY